ncbi:ABC transporter permease [Sinorhizobium meliloti]|uniref:ABC transporter permease n=1 Tax=Rhizobium meliloti TaxID=382 RepID=UPI001F20DE2A|nr:ABC transporter permease subunit [Sinorhizobium meliloti]
MQRVSAIVLLAALPSLFTGVREGLAAAWQSLVIVELFASFDGLGYLMTWGRQLFQLELVIVAMIVIAAIGLSLERDAFRRNRKGDSFFCANQIHHSGR